MGREIKVKVTCDVCGKTLTGDAMCIDIDGDEYFVCLPRTAPINKCGNQAKRKLLEVFKRSELAAARLKDLDRAD